MSAVICDSVSPARRRRVRSTCIARSRSPSRNQSAPPTEAMVCHERPGLVAPAPALLGVVEAGQHVGQRVDVGADLQAEMLEVVAGVGDDQQLVGAAARGSGPRPAWPRRHRRTGRRPVLCSPEHVLGRGPHQLGGRVVGRRPGKAAHQDDRLRLVALALHERGGGGDLVGEARDADLQGAAEQVGIAAQVEQGRQARGADGDALRCRAARRGRSCR